MKIHEIEKCLQEVIKECHHLNIPISKQIDPKIRINKRAKSRFAACMKDKRFQDPVFVIEIGNALLEIDEKKVGSILAHEVLHTCYGCNNHGRVWKAYAYKMNRTYGYQIKTTASYEELGLAKPDKTIRYRYVIVCKKCSKKFYRQKRSKLITNLSQYRCQCGGKLECRNLDQESEA